MLRKETTPKVNKRIYLSPPNIGNPEKEAIIRALESGWVAPHGPSLASFESKLSEFHYPKKALLTNTGTAALHLALKLAGVQMGDFIAVSSFTFAASVNAVLYEKAVPIFIDSETDSWNIDSEVFENYLKNSLKKPKFLIVTHLYGVPAQLDQLKKVCQENGVILIEDAAEALGASFDEKPVGTFGDYAVLSFNGNKIITTSGGGALLCNEEKYYQAKHLATQANTAKYDYEHDEVGYNYRMSNLLAALGEAQMQQLANFVEKKRAIFDYYKDNLSDIMNFPEEPKNTFCNRWLTTALFHEKIDVLDFAKYMDEQNIEVRRLWKPLHLHQAYKDFQFIGNGICEKFHEKGICFPSGTSLTIEQQNYVIEKTRDYPNAF